MSRRRRLPHEKPRSDAVQHLEYRFGDVESTPILLK